MAQTEHSNAPTTRAARAVSPPSLPALFSLDDKKARALSEARKKGMRQWRRAKLEGSLPPAELLALKLSSSNGSVGGLFLGYLSRDHHLSSTTMAALVLSYLGLPAPGLESLASDADPQACSAFVRSSAERIATHDGVRDALGGRCKAAGQGVEYEVTGRFGPLPADNAGEPAPGAPRLGCWRRMDLEVRDPASGRRTLLDATTPCGLTAPRVLAFAKGGSADAHILEAERRKVTKYVDKPAGFAFVAAVVGMHGEVGAALHAFLAGLATLSAERSGILDPFAKRRHRQAFLHQSRLALSIALARGKAAQINLARDKLAGVVTQRARTTQ